MTCVIGAGLMGTDFLLKSPVLINQFKVSKVCLYYLKCFYHLYVEMGNSHMCFWLKQSEEPNLLRSLKVGCS